MHPESSRLLRKQTCAFSPAGRKVGCLGDTTYYDCNLDIGGNSRWLFAQEGFTGYADANAQRLQPGVWRIREWPSRKVIGRAIATNSTQTRWKIRDRRGSLVATVQGKQGPQLAMVLLYWGTECLD